LEQVDGILLRFLAERALDAVANEIISEIS
jgi:hypothetical protein